MLIMYMMYGILKTNLNKIRHSYHHLKYVFNQNTWNNQQEISILASLNVVCYLLQQVCVFHIDSYLWLDIDNLHLNRKSLRPKI